MEKNENLFKPRDFIYINNQKLDSYFSQLFGGLVQNIDVSEAKSTEGNHKIAMSGEMFAKFGLGKNTAKLAEFILSQIGNFEASAKVGLQGEIGKKNADLSSLSSKRTLEHFKYALFEQSLVDLGYLIDINNVIIERPKIDSGTISGNLRNADFIKFEASEIEMSDYRNASNFIKLIKRIVELSAEIKSGELMDLYADQAADLLTEGNREYFRTKSLALLGNAFNINNKDLNEASLSKGKIIDVIVKAADEAFSGNLIPLDVLLTAHFSLKNNMGELIFESQLKDDFFLEQRTDIAFKYGYFEDAKWTIVGQITSLKAPEPAVIKNTIAEMQERFKGKFENKDLDVNWLVKTIVSEIDILSKRLGLLPQLGQKHIAFTPIAIYREPKINKYFLRKN